MSVYDIEDVTVTVEERIRDHYTARVRSLRAPPMCYRVHPYSFDGIARRLQAKIEFGEREPDMVRAEFITLSLSHGVVRVFMARDVPEDRVGFVEFTGERHP